MIDATARGEPASPARPARAPRRAPSDLRSRSTRPSSRRAPPAEPDWLAADRRAAFARLPRRCRSRRTSSTRPTSTSGPPTSARSGRGTRRSRLRPEPHPTPTRRRPPAMPRTLRRSRRSWRTASRRISLGDEARAAGVVLDTLAGLVARDGALGPAAPRGRHDASGGRQAAQLTRAGWNQGLVLHVPAGVRLDAPVVLRWRSDAGGRALLTRTIVDLGEGASASLVEELQGSAGAADRGEPQALFTGTLEVHLAAGAELRVASIQDLPERNRRVPASPGRDRRGRDAPLGARPARRRGSSGAASTTAWTATGARSSRSRSCSAPTTSSST